MAKVHHIFINYNVLTNNFHTHQLFTSSSSYFLPIVFPILPPPFLPSPPPLSLPSATVFPAICSALSCRLHQSFLSAAPLCLAVFISLSCQLLRSVLLSSPRCLAGFVSLSCSMRHTVLVSHMPRTCKLFSPLSNPIYAFIHSRTCPSTSENMPFLMLERALLDARKAFSTFVFITIWNSAGYVLPSYQHSHRK